MALVELRNQVTPSTFQAFEMYALRGYTPEDTASALETSLSNVYCAKSRCAARLREIIKLLDDSER